MRNSLISAAILSVISLSGSVQAQKAKPATAPAPFCPALKQIIAAATETPTFASIAKPPLKGKTEGDGKLMVQGFWSCTYSRSMFGGTQDDRYTCMSNPELGKVATEILSRKTEGELSQCLGVAPSKPGMMQDRGGNHLIYRAVGTAKPVQVSKKDGYGFAFTVVTVEVGGRVR